jgi:hypothetical protein
MWPAERHLFGQSPFGGAKDGRKKLQTNAAAAATVNGERLAELMGGATERGDVALLSTALSSTGA